MIATSFNLIFCLNGVGQCIFNILLISDPVTIWFRANTLPSVQEWNESRVTRTALSQPSDQCLSELWACSRTKLGHALIPIENVEYACSVFYVPGERLNKRPTGCVAVLCSLELMKCIRIEEMQRCFSTLLLLPAFIYSGGVLYFYFVGVVNAVN